MRINVLTCTVFNLVLLHTVFLIFFFFFTSFTTNCQYLQLIVIRTILLNLILLNYNETVRIKILSIMPFIIIYRYIYYIFVYNIAINPVK